VPNRALLQPTSCVFADAQYRTAVMHSSIKSAFSAGQALTVQLSKGDLVDPLKASRWAAQAI
jgi:4-hydroxy-4-methyl-2-oxoglutarate aldolase